VSPGNRTPLASGNHDSGFGDPLAVTILAVAGLILAVSGLAWLAACGAVLLNGHSPAAPFATSPSFVIDLVKSHDPATAWRKVYPRAAVLDVSAFWLLFTAGLLLFTTVGVVALLRWSQHVAGRRSEPATWATGRQERRIAVPLDPANRRWRIVAGRGRASRRLLAGQDCVSAVAFGPNGSGKTTSLIVPNALDWDGPVVLTTAKPQDLEPICTARARRGPVWVIAPGGAPGHRTVGWSPLHSVHDDDTADRMAEWMVDCSGMTGDPKARPWNAQARKYLKGLLLAASLHDGGFGQWIQWIYAGERARDHVEDILRTADHEQTAVEYGSTWTIHEEGKGSVLFTALGLAEVYSRPAIRLATERGGFTPTQLFAEQGTLCIVTPNAEGDRFAPYFTTLLSAIIHTAETAAAQQGGPIEPRLLLALDEAGNVFRYPRLPHLLTTARGNGLQLLLIYHDLAQIEHLYGGREVARTVVSNAKMRMLLPGVGDLDTLRYWSDLIGQTRTQTHGITTGADGRRSRSRSEHADHLAPLHKLQQLPDGQAVLLYQNLPPARVRLLPWYADRRYRQLNSEGDRP
jgi:type IV secretory pathway TraG/TraD family ATPase VirD4